MIRINSIDGEVYVADEPVVYVGRSEIEFLKQKVHATEGKRVRLCAHKRNEDTLHETFVVYAKGTYLRPSEHVNTGQSFHVVEGLADVVLFDEQGKITDVIPMGDYSSGRRFYCRISESAYHTLLIESDVLVIHKTTHGPSQKSDAILAPWAPEESDMFAVTKFMAQLASQVQESGSVMIRVKPVNREVYVADEPVVYVGRSEIEFLKERVDATERKRVRLCAHKDVGDKLHEMFIVLTGGTYLRPSKHLKDESVHIVEGAVDYIFFDDRGNIAQVLPMGDYLSGGRFYCRVPESVYHTLIIRSDLLVFHETSHGPFRRSDTVFAPWAPEEGDIAAVGRFAKEIGVAAANFLIRSTEQA
jgi:cupin fold WbuC family metalloprotein